MPRVLVLIDGEHYPPVVRAAIARRPGVVGAVLVGGGEKLTANPDFGVPFVTGATPTAAVLAGIDRFQPDEVLDLADEPVLDARPAPASPPPLCSSAACPISAATSAIDPPPRPRLSTHASVAVIGNGKRTGKTAVAAHVAQLLRADGTPPVIVTMGRGGPPEPEVIDPTKTDLTPAGLVALAERGRHAASDHFEDAVTAGVVTVGTRRCGGGLAGAPADDTFAAGVALADGLAEHALLFEGSGSAVPPAHADATICVLSGEADFELVTGYLGPYRILLSDLIVVTMVEEPLADSATALTARVRELAAGEHPAKTRSVVWTVLRPVPSYAGLRTSSFLRNYRPRCRRTNHGDALGAGVRRRGRRPFQPTG